MPCSGFPRAPGSCGSRWAGSRGEAGAQRPFLLFCLLEEGQLWDSKRTSAPPPSPLCPTLSVFLHVRDGARGNGQERAGAGSALHWDPGEHPDPNPALAARVCLALSLRTLAQSSYPSARGTWPLGDPGHWDWCCICRSAAPSSQAVMGCFQHRQRSIGWAQGRAATLCRYGHAQGSVPPLPPQRCPGSGCVAVGVVAGPPELCILPSAAAGWMPGQTDDGLILPGGFCAIMGKALQESLCRLSQPSAGLCPAVNFLFSLQLYLPLMPRLHPWMTAAKPFALLSWQHRAVGTQDSSALWVQLVLLPLQG